MDIEKLYNALCESWSKETCYPTSQESWSKGNMTLGQCAITALVVNDYLGGQIKRCMVGDVSHYYNEIDGNVIDLTSLQFEGIIPNYSLGVCRTREYLLSNEDTKNRYELLKSNVIETLSAKKLEK